MARATGTHYDALGLQKSASLEEAKAAYKAAALRLHPDKQLTREKRDPPLRHAMSNQVGNPEAKEGNYREDEFSRVQKAWEVLRDPASRASYDSQLSLQQTADTTPISEELDLEDMEEMAENGTYIYTHSCRCGSVYEISATELSESATSVLVGCKCAPRQVGRIINSFTAQKQRYG